MTKTPTPEPNSVRQRLRDTGLYGLAAQDDTVLAEPWVEHVIDIEDRERKRRSLERRLTNARISAFKPIADFDWAWPNRMGVGLTLIRHAARLHGNATTLPGTMTS